MISNKTLLKLMLTVLGVIPITFASSNDTPKPSHSSNQLIISRGQKSASKPKKNSIPVLKDASSGVGDVQVESGTTVDVNRVQRRVPLVNEQFKKLIDQGGFGEVVELGDTMRKAEFSIQACLFVKTIDQYSGIVEHPKRRTMIPAFFVYGDINVVREAIAAESRYYGDDYNIYDDNLKFAISVAFKIDRHDRIIELLEIRRKVTEEEDRQSECIDSSFWLFLKNLFSIFAPEKDDVPLKRFLIFKGEEFRSKNPDLYDIFCRMLVFYLKNSYRGGNSKELLVDLVGQPSLLTPKIFADGFFEIVYANGDECITFINCDWAEAINEGLKEEYTYGGANLWRIMTKKFPKLFSEDYPGTNELRTAASKKFSTKEQLEERWVKKNAPHFSKQLEEFIINIFPSVLVKIIFEYAVPRPTMLDDQRIKILQNKFTDVIDE